MLSELVGMGQEGAEQAGGGEAWYMKAELNGEEMHLFLFDIKQNL